MCDARGSFKHHPATYCFLSSLCESQCLLPCSIDWLWRLLFIVFTALCVPIKCRLNFRRSFGNLLESWKKNNNKWHISISWIDVNLWGCVESSYAIGQCYVPTGGSSSKHNQLKNWEDFRKYCQVWSFWPCFITCFGAIQGRHKQ